MKKLVLLALFVSGTLLSQAQALNPVTWSFSAVKISDKEYEIHMKANIQSGWHLYSQNQPDNAINMPTEFTFNANPLFTREGKVKEVGNMELVKDAVLKSSANQYSNTVEFIQKIKLKAKAKTNITGNVEYQTCDDKKCLPPKKVNFNIALN